MVLNIFVISPHKIFEVNIHMFMKIYIYVYIYKEVRLFFCMFVWSIGASILAVEIWPRKRPSRTFIQSGTICEILNKTLYRDSLNLWNN